MHIYLTRNKSTFCTPNRSHSPSRPLAGHRSPRRRRPRHRLPLLLPPSPATMAQTTAPFSRSAIAPSTYGAPQRTCSRTFGLQSSDLLIDRSEARNNNQPLPETHSTLQTSLSHTKKKEKKKALHKTHMQTNGQKTKMYQIRTTKALIKIKVVSLSSIKSMCLYGF